MSASFDSEPAQAKDLSSYLSSERSSWPAPLSEAAYYGIAGEVVRGIEPHTEADPAALLVQSLVVAGNVIGRGPHFRAEADCHYTNLATVLVGETAKGRKGSSLNRIKAAFIDVDTEWAESRIASGLSSGEGLIHAVRDPLHKSEPIKQKGKVVGYQDVIVDEGVSDKRLLVVESEFASTMRVMERDGNTLSPVIREAWDGGHLQILTRNSPETATGGHISIICHVTRDEVRRYLTRTELGNGFANRFLWVCVRRSKLLPDGGGPIEAESEVRQRLIDAVNFARQVGEIRRDGAAAALWRDVYPELSAGRDGLLGSVTSRAEAQVMRLATVYALLDGSPCIARVHLEAALEIWRYCADSAYYIFGDVIGDPVADELLVALRRAGTVGMTRTAVSVEVFSRNRGAVEIDRALAVLEQRGSARRTTETTAGRPAVRWTAT